MQISSSVTTVDFSQKSSGMKSLFTEKLSKDEVSELREQITQNAHAYSQLSLSVQTNILSTQDQFANDYKDFQSFLSGVGYEGKPIAELSKDEVAALVSEDGIFGVTQTSERVANFVINGSGGDESMMRAGREGMIRGFKEAEKMWGGELPEISQKTMSKAIEMVDMAMNDLGFSILDQEA
ncbi:MAG: hypothetical protein AUK54_07045 [Helicobacteraceae bacterium CG2_30_36_10]|nr:MAG: hypothetical protein AUK54_07045 [Helicobacteraceae bacterium CG2_30_36_10]